MVEGDTTISRWFEEVRRQAPGDLDRLPKSCRNDYRLLGCTGIDTSL